MKYVQLNKTELFVSRAAIGTDSIGTYIDETESKNILDSFTEFGGNLIDTAVSYADWVPGEKSRSEKLIGRWMKEKHNRDKLVLSTKGGCPNRNTMHISRLSREEINSDMDKSLMNLGVDYVDIYFLHRDDKSIAAGELMEILGELTAAGKTRYFGLSNWSAERIAEAEKYCGEHGLNMPVVSQIQFSPARPNLECIESTLEMMNADAFDFYSREKMNVFAFSAQAKGYFSKLDMGIPLSPKAQSRYDNETNKEIYKLLKAMSADYGCSVTELVVAVTASNPEFITVPIIGCKNTEQVRTSIRGAELEISAEDTIRVLKQGLIVHN
ncbi:MAG: aldo/keto reductase [Clostridia bacterium]|nr:aldo/keto reductase [Clostridia bacterium]